MEIFENSITKLYRYEKTYTSKDSCDSGHCAADGFYSPNIQVMELYLSERDKRAIRKLQKASKIWVYEIRDNITVEGCGKAVKAWDNLNDQECVIKNLPK